MGSFTAEMDSWLRGGRLLIGASDRAARAIANDFHGARRAEGLSAWTSPRILDWSRFARSAWQERDSSARMVLNSVQELALWSRLAAGDGQLSRLLEGPRRRVARLAMEAHALLCNYAPQFLRESSRGGWQQDAEVFSRWLAAFDAVCAKEGVVSNARLPLELAAMLKCECIQRPGLLLTGFDRILPTQKEVLEAWGEWRLASQDDRASTVHYHEAEEPGEELEACAKWCSARLKADPDARLLVVAQDVAQQRGQIERAFLRVTESSSLPFEFTLGVPLIQVGLIRAACLLLSWLSGPVAEHELDWLFASGHSAVALEEIAGLQRAMRKLRQFELERPRWSLESFLGQHLVAEPVPLWRERMRQARATLIAQPRMQSPVEWAELVPRLLTQAGWPGNRPLSSAEFQAQRRWQQALESCASLGFDGTRMQWEAFMTELLHTVEEMLFAAESRSAPIQISGPTESAGLSADAVWVLGADEDNWPGHGSTNPLLPIAVQRDARMPHASAQEDWDLGRVVAQRLECSAPEVHFSYAKQVEGTERRASRLVLQFAGTPEPPRKEPAIRILKTQEFQDASRVPLSCRTASGGASVLTNQSQCPFKAFAVTRLGARGWKAAEAGLTPAQRGQLLHAILHSVWHGPGGIGSHEELMKLPNREEFIRDHVRRSLRERMPQNARDRMPRRYLELEEQRLTDLMGQWLDFEATRQPFTVEKSEAEAQIDVAGLALRLRLDRIDVLNDGTRLVVDYKTGSADPKDWDPPRPKDVQLPIYAGFAVKPEEGRLGGLVFAKVRPGAMEFAGRVKDARGTLLQGLHSANHLVRGPLNDSQVVVWRTLIDRLAQDFMEGRATVDPIEYPKTCERCDLKALCRIEENRPMPEADSGFSEGTADD